MNNEDDAGWEFETVKGDDVSFSLNQIRPEERKNTQLTQSTVRPRQSSVLPSSLRLLFNGDHSTTFGASSATITASMGRTHEESPKPGGEINHSHDAGFSCPDLHDGSYPFPGLVDAEIQTTTYGLGQSHLREQQSMVQEMSPNPIYQNLPSPSTFAEQREMPNSDLYSMNDLPREVADSAPLSSEFSVRSPKTLNSTPATSRLAAVVPSGKGMIPHPVADGSPDLHVNNFGTPGLKDVIKVNLFLWNSSGH